MGGTPGFWGKTDTLGWHPLPCHSLDVAAVGRVLLERDPALASRLSDLAGLERSDTVELSTFLLALHDIGKFSDGFQGLRPELMARLQGRRSRAPYGGMIRHDGLGYSWAHWRLPRLLIQLSLTEGVDEPADLRDVLVPLLSAVAGHHGKPPAGILEEGEILRQFPPPVESALYTFVAEMASLTIPDGLPLRSDQYEKWLACLPRTSWLLAGVAVLCDWIGSNRTWFPFDERDLAAEEYLESVALPRARVAVAEAGVLPCRAAEGSFRSLFPLIPALSDIQRLADTVRLGCGPQLYVIEEVTGGGKTEAALRLAHRIMDAGDADGLYFALPTMATANAMLHRVAPLVERLFAEGASPSLVLAHSARHLIHALERPPDEIPYVAQETAASSDCAAWLSDSRKKALLAHVGVGTIDQALLAVLHTKHQSLRTLGLHRKVLLVDEVHACDAYVNRLLTELLRFHASLGGSAILLSATLPLETRQGLVDAFREGAGQVPAACDWTAYPVLVQSNATGTREHPAAARPGTARRTDTVILDDTVAVDHHLSSVLDSGGCACWLRNTVDDAIRTARIWIGRIGAERVHLLHSRFVLADRLAIEQDLINRFGPGSSHELRTGRLVIATQVVEQSLDIDFDGMVSDLAPADLVLQRAGRLHRHARDKRGNRTDGSDRRGAAVLVLFGPTPVVSPPSDWYSRLLPRAGYVYPDHGRLWLTANWLAGHGGFSVPEDNRTFIEAVYGPESEEWIPEGLRARTAETTGEDMARRSIAADNAIVIQEGYVPLGQTWWEDDVSPTRLGDPTIQLRLARRGADGEIEPLRREQAYPWDMSQISVRKERVSGFDPALTDSEREDLVGLLPDRGKYSIAAILEERGGTLLGSVQGGSGQTTIVRYDPRFGLEYGSSAGEGA